MIPIEASDPPIAPYSMRPAVILPTLIYKPVGITWLLLALGENFLSAACLHHPAQIAMSSCQGLS